MTLIFNADHDLCLSNGGRNYIAPQSARLFSEQCSEVMRIIYHKDFFQPKSEIIPWGWNKTLKQNLIRQGHPTHLLPSDTEIDAIKELQHRSTALPLLKDSIASHSIAEIEQYLEIHSEIVLKAPWSGSGRGLRWVSGQLSGHDIQWAQKTISAQRCVIAEPRRTIAHNFALEYYRHNHRLHFVGFSLFTTKNGVYQSNVLIDDNSIQELIKFPAERKEKLEIWMTNTIPDFYEGAIGIDYYTDIYGEIYCSEVNFRHTMGLVAHEYRRCHPEHDGWLFSIGHNRPDLYRIEITPNK